MTASDLVFSVPQNLKHPLSGIDNSVRSGHQRHRAQEPRRSTARSVGFYEKIGCKGSKRMIRATFITEATASQPAQKFTATKQAKC